MLTERYRVIRYGARGFGSSPEPTVRFSRLADLIRVLGHYGIDRAALVGCSQGGSSALGLALAIPCIDYANLCGTMPDGSNYNGSTWAASHPSDPDNQLVAEAHVYRRKLVGPPDRR